MSDVRRPGSEDRRYADFDSMRSDEEGAGTMSVYENLSDSGRIEWDRMVSGQVYRDTHPDIEAARVRAGRLFTEYNTLGYGHPDEQREILTILLRTIGDGVIVRPNFRCELGCNISLGSNVHINYDCVILDNAPVNIESNVWIAPKAGLFATNHALDYDERIRGACQARPITIRDGAWLGGHAIVLGGVTIGRGAVIGAGSVVTHDIPDHTVAVGNPAHILRPITPEDKTGYLERIGEEPQYATSTREAGVPGGAVADDSRQ